MAKEMYCTRCGTVAKPKREMKGSFVMEVFLWLLLLVPGLLYSIWRLTTKYNACPKCLSDAIVPLDSPTAIAALKK